MSAIAKKLNSDRARIGLEQISSDKEYPTKSPEPQSEVLAIADSRSDSIPPSDAEISTVVTDVRAEQAKNLETALHAAAAELDIYLDQQGAMCLDVTRNSGRVDCAYADGEDASDYIADKLHKATGRHPTSSALDRFMQIARVRARAAQKHKHVYNRVGVDRQDMVLDLANEVGEVVRVNAAGYAVGHAGDIRFRRGSGCGELPYPAQMTAMQGHSVLVEFLVGRGVQKADLAPLITKMVEDIRINCPNPILELEGNAGTGKTTTARDLISITDPSPAGDIPTTNMNERDLMAGSSSRYALMLDNRSKLSEDEQDLLCRVSTGGVLEARELYSQRTVVTVHIQRPLTITTITPVITRSDARSRTLGVKLQPLNRGYRSEQDIRDEFKKLHPQLLGAVCTLLSAGLAGLPTVKTQRLYTHRLADFEQLGEAIHQAIGHPPGWFGTELAARRKDDAEAAAEANPLLTAVLKAHASFRFSSIYAVPHQPSGRELLAKGACVWTANGKQIVFGTAAMWLKEIKSEFDVPFYVLERGPKNERALRNALQHLQPTMKELGLELSVRKVTDRWAIGISQVVTQGVGDA
jgi:hypothetical protein